MRNEAPPGPLQRIFAVWRRHQRCYFKELIANGLPPFLEPLLYVLALGVGLGMYIKEMDGMSYAAFLASGMLATSSFYSASYETTFGTFVRLEFQKVYDNILATPATFRDIFWGELLWCGTKGAMFSASVLLVISCFGLVTYPWALLTPCIGFINGMAFGALGFFMTGYTRSINNFNIYFTAVLTPMFFFCGTVFPVSQLPPWLQMVVNLAPLTHAVALMRALVSHHLRAGLWLHLLLLMAIPAPFAMVSYYKLKNRLLI